jgi:hypothetical protein
MRRALLHTLLLWPIPPAYSGRIVAALGLTVAGVLVFGLHSFPLVAAAAVVSVALTFGAHAAYRRLPR